MKTIQAGMLERFQKWCQNKLFTSFKEQHSLNLSRRIQQFLLILTPHELRVSTELQFLISCRCCYTTVDSPVYRIFGDLKFVTDMRVLGGAESKNRIRFCPSGQDQLLEGIRFAVFRKIFNIVIKSFKSYLSPFFT